MSPRLGESELVRRLLAHELERFDERHRSSLALYQRAVGPLPLGVPSGVCALDPYPVAVDYGQGAYLNDIDGNRYVDYHNGFGTSVFGHAHPLITAAIERQAQKGCHFGAMTSEAARWAEVICERYQLDWVRFSNSGTEATMDALRLARAATGRTTVAKVEGAYHGSHEIALVSPNFLPLDGHEGPDRAPFSRPASLGLSARLLEEVVALPFNDLDAAGRALAGGEIAAMIVEPILFNVGTIWPQAGYLEGLRELCDKNGTLLIFDETKTGATIAWGGAEELFGVMPDIKTLGKGIGGGLPVGAIGDRTGQLYDLIDSWEVPHLGTFGGNPLTAAAGRAALEDVLVPSAYAELREHHTLLSSLLQTVIDRYELPAYVTGVAAKGCLVWVDGSQLRDYRDWRRRYDSTLGYLCWLYASNRGVFLSPGQDEQWTSSVCHGQHEAELFAAAVEELGSDLRR